MGSTTAVMMTTAVGTPMYMAPELGDVVQNHLGIPLAIDMYAFGVLANTIWSGREPFSSVATTITNPFQLMQQVQSGLRPDISADTPEVLRTIITRCWGREPSDRPMASALVVQLEQLCDREEMGSGSMRSFTGSMTGSSMSSRLPRNNSMLGISMTDFSERTISGDAASVSASVPGEGGGARGTGEVVE